MSITEISFKADADAVRGAIELVRILPPSGVTEQGLQGLLFVVGTAKDKKEDGTPGPKDGKPYCWVYSRDGLHATRAEFPVEDLQGEGGFVYLWDHIESFKNVSGTVTFSVKNDQENSAFTLRWEYSDQNHKDRTASSERPTFDPRLLASLDKRLTEATNYHLYKTAILREAIKAGKGFLASDSDRNAKDEYKIINIYDQSMTKDGKGDGTLHATDGYRRLYFHCKDFEGKGLQLHSNHIGIVESFLSKCGPEVWICTGTDMTYALSKDKDKVLGWSKHTKPALEYKALPKTWDKVVLNVKDRNFLMGQLQIVKHEMQKGRDKIRIKFDSANKYLTLHILTGSKYTSLPIDVDVVPVAEGAESPNYEFDVNIEQLIQLFDVKASVVEFRTFFMEEHGGPKGGAGFRTIDEYLVKADGTVIGGSGATPNTDEFQCRVTRFMPSKM